jgi:hypothetical protein
LGQAPWTGKSKPSPTICSSNTRFNVRCCRWCDVTSPNVCTTALAAPRCQRVRRSYQHFQHVSNQQNLMTLFDALMNKLGVLVNKIGDEVVKVRSSVSPPEISLFFKKKKIHPYVNLAWQVLSAGMKVSRFRLSMSFFLIYICSIRWSKPNRLETSRF